MGREHTQFKPGNDAGRKPGARNRVGAGLRDTFVAVFEELQEDEECNLAQWARENPTEFYRLVSRLLPQEYTGDFYTVIEVKLKDDEQDSLDEAATEVKNTIIAPTTLNLLPDVGGKNDFG